MEGTLPEKDPLVGPVCDLTLETEDGKDPNLEVVTSQPPGTLTGIPLILLAAISPLEGLRASHLEGPLVSRVEPRMTGQADQPPEAGVRTPVGQTLDSCDRTTQKWCRAPTAGWGTTLSRRSTAPSATLQLTTMSSCARSMPSTAMGPVPSVEEVITFTLSVRTRWRLSRQVLVNPTLED